jgi:hypothetical protein
MGPMYSPRGKSGVKLMSRGIILALAVFVAAAESNPTQQPLTPAEKAAIERVAAHASSGADNVGQMLNGIGYSPDIPGFKAFPAVRKIEAAYLAAEQGTPGSGKLVIALLSKQIGNKYESARQDPTLKLFAALSADPTQLKFVDATSRPKPGPQVTSAIATLADYAEGNALGGSQAVLRDYFGLSSDRVYDILRNSESTADAITKGINWVPESQRRRKLSDLVAEIDRAYDGAAMMEASLNEYRPKPPEKTQDKSGEQKPRNKAEPKPQDKVVPPITHAGNPPTEGPPTAAGNPPIPRNPNSPHQGGGGGTGGSDGAVLGASPFEPWPALTMTNEVQGTERYREFLENHYSEASSESRSGGGGGSVHKGAVQGVFEAVVEGRGGFGGIVFGNDVVQTPGFGKLISLYWIPSADDEEQQTGRIAFDVSQTFQGTTRVVHKFYGPVLLEDAYAAYRIIYPHDGLPEWSKGQGIGLMSLYDGGYYVDCDANRPSNHTVYWRALLNPALLNTGLGQSAEVVDSLPIVRKKFAAMIVGNDASQLSGDVDEWLALTPATWKFTDRPVVIGSVGQRITVRPASVADVSGDASRFIEVRAFERNSWVTWFRLFDKSGESSFPEGFARLFPQIVRGSHEFSRINGFAPVLALFRWARSTNATVVGSIPIPVPIPTPEALLISKNSIAPTIDMPPNRIRELDRANIDMCLSKITSDLPASEASLLTQEQSIWKQAALQLEPAADARTARQMFLARTEYMENVAKIAARHSPAGQALLDRRPPDLTRLLVERFSPKNLTSYDHLVEQIQLQDNIIEKQSEAYDEALRSALDDQVLSRKLMEVGPPSGISQYDSLVQKETAATEELKNLQRESDELDQSFEDFEQSCIRGLSPSLQRQFEQSESDKAEILFVARHCAGAERKIKQVSKEQDDITDHEKQATATRSAAAKELIALIKAALPTIGLWREFSTSYVPISHKQELEEQWPDFTDNAQR